MTRMRGNVIQIRVSDEEKNRIQKAADQAGLKVSEYVRRKVAPTLEEAQGDISAVMESTRPVSPALRPPIPKKD